MICGQHQGGLDHLFLKCRDLLETRTDLTTYMNLLDRNRIWECNRDNIIYMFNIPSEDIYYLISEYKYTVWRELMNAVIERKPYNVEKVKQQLTKTLQFYIDHLAE